MNAQPHLYFRLPATALIINLYITPQSTSPAKDTSKSLSCIRSYGYTKSPVYIIDFPDRARTPADDGN